MPFLTLNEGHYRALEKSLADLVHSVPQGSRTALVTAGEVQAERIRRVLLDGAHPVLAGLEILPGISRLAYRLSADPFPGTAVPVTDIASMALAALSGLSPQEPFYGMAGNASSALSMGSFFERLLEQGITPGMYSVSSGMLREEPGPVAAATGRMFEEYCRERSIHYPLTADIVMSEAPGPDRSVYGIIVFYGFYDLNPGQRRFVKRLGKTVADIHWFSPVHPSSPWRDVYGRTGEFLRGLGFRERHRIDWSTELSCPAETALWLLGETGTSPSGGTTGIVAAAGEMGEAREVLDTVSRLSRKGISWGQIAVVTRRPAESILPRFAHHEGVPIHCPLSVPLAELPLARLITAVTRLPDSDFHYSRLEEITSTGLLDPLFDPGTGGIRAAVAATGVRTGLDDWRTALGEDSPMYRLVSRLGDFFDGTGAVGDPLLLLGSLRTLVADLTSLDPADPLLAVMLPEDGWRFREPAGWKRFSDVLQRHLETVSTDLLEGDRDGFRLLSFEQVRGTLWSHVIVLGLEDGTFPSRQNDDPRLPSDLRTALQLPDPAAREREEAYLFFQAMEASASEVILIYRNQDSRSRPSMPSPFISRGVCPGGAAGPVSFSRRPPSPAGILAGGNHRGQRAVSDALGGSPSGGRYFLERAVEADRTRFSSDPFDEYDGIIGEGYCTREEWTASSLSGYVSCPFAWMAENVWGLEREEDAGTSFEPDPMTRGDLVHRCFERLMSSGGFEADPEVLMRELEGAAEDRGIWRKLGSKILSQAYLRGLEGMMTAALARFVETGWRPLSWEKSATGSFGGLRVSGRIDLVVEKGDGSLLVVDLKTGSLRGKAGKKKDAIRNGILYQPCMYRSLLRQTMGPEGDERDVSMAYVHVTPRDPFEMVEFADADLRELEEVSAANAAEAAALARGGLFPPVSSSGGICTNCSFRDLCRASPADRIEWKLRDDDRLGLLIRARTR
jgi:CRISPR/Cas system-associated exonuclease Cas4 (RecB family)